MCPFGDLVISTKMGRDKPRIFLVLPKNWNQKPFGSWCGLLNHPIIKNVSPSGPIIQNTNLPMHNAVMTIDLGNALRYGDQLNVVASDDIFANDAQACPKKKRKMRHNTRMQICWSWLYDHYHLPSPQDLVNQKCYHEWSLVKCYLQFTPKNIKKTMAQENYHRDQRQQWTVRISTKQ